MAKRVSAVRLSGEPSGSRQSSKGSRRDDSQWKVEDVILKHSLKESGFRGMGVLTFSLLRLRFLERRDREVAAISDVERK